MRTVTHRPQQAEAKTGAPAPVRARPRPEAKRAALIFPGDEPLQRKAAPLDTGYEALIAAGSRAIQRKETKRTEKRVINEALASGGLTDKGAEELLEKMSRGQSSRSAMTIAAEIEVEAARLVQSLPEEEQTKVKEAITNYVMSSVAIQTSARGNPEAMDILVQKLDNALDAIRGAAGKEAKSRVVYRKISYRNMDEIPYGNPSAGNPINEGDTVSDAGFVSTSEHRHFILEKEERKDEKEKKNTETPVLAKLAIYGSSGAPIALHFFDPPKMSYTNENERRLWEMDQGNRNALAKTWNSVFGGPRPGQAEVLFPRNTWFKVKRIQRERNTVSVVLEEQRRDDAGTLVKDMKWGTPLP